MKKNCTILFVLIVNISLKSQGFPFKVQNSIRQYTELTNPSFICKDSIGKKHWFTLDQPMRIFKEEVDSFYIMDWSNLHINLGNKMTKESDLFVPFNTALRKKTSASDSVGFSIAYKMTGEAGNRTLTVQWKDIKPKYVVAPNDVFNIQMILDEKDQSVSYHFGPMPPEFNSFFSLFGQNRVPALYFLDDFSSFFDTINEVYYITSPIHDINKVELAEFVLLDGHFTDEQYSSSIFYNCPSLPIEEGLYFKISLRNLSIVKELEVNAQKSNIYPNPTSNELSILSNEPIKTKYEIFNINGVSEQIGIIENNTINIEQLSPGLHLLKWSTAQGEVYINRFVKL